MPKGQPGSGSVTVARPFSACWSETRALWTVQQGPRRRYAASLCIQVTVTAEGAKLVGVGVVRCLQRGELVVTA